jgi:hypothetical protein
MGGPGVRENQQMFKLALFGRIYDAFINENLRHTQAENAHANVASYFKTAAFPKLSVNVCDPRSRLRSKLGG